MPDQARRQDDCGGGGDAVSGHTPGPWHTDGISEYTGEMLVRAKNGDTVARVCCYGPQSETPDAQQYNVNLIAAAPDLAAALSALVLNITWGGATFGAIQDARDALAKALWGGA